MTNENRAIEYLSTAKVNVKQAFTLIDPAAIDPAARAILKALDSIDAAIVAIVNRGKHASKPPQT